MSSPVLQVSDLKIQFATPTGVIHAVNGISFTVSAGETVAIVGESGSGKSVTALAVMGLLALPGRQTGGEVLFSGQSLTNLPDRAYQDLRGREMAMIFQDPLSSLNPAFRVGAQIVEAMTTHGVNKLDARARSIDLMRSVGIPDPERRTRDYPHQFSGGMRQRAMIAMAIANSPQLLIADEPTTALDVTIQAQVLEVLLAAQRKSVAALLLITHDLGVVAGTADRVLVMYAGRIIEEGLVDEVLTQPRHPYTQGLLAALPRLDQDRKTFLRTISGAPPSLVDDKEACALAPRCEYARDECSSTRPVLNLVANAVSNSHRVACLRADELVNLTSSK